VGKKVTKLHYNACWNHVLRGKCIIMQFLADGKDKRFHRRDAECAEGRRKDLRKMREEKRESGRQRRKTKAEDKGGRQRRKTKAEDKGGRQRRKT
jgi:hypothetical protein